MDVTTNVIKVQKEKIYIERAEAKALLEALRLANQVR